MIVRIAELEIDPDRLDEYSAMLSEQIEASVRLEPGVIFLFALAVRDTPHMVRVVEGYADEAAYAAHLSTPHFVRYKSESADLVRSLRLIETEPIAVRAKDRLPD